MDIVVGSHNKAKVNAVRKAYPHQHILSAEVDSLVSDQPRSDTETKQGALNRAVACRELKHDSIGVGLEGGVTEIDGTLYLCSWGAMITQSRHQYIASGSRIPLPKEVSHRILLGEELGPVMVEYTNDHSIRHNQGAIGVFTNGVISREEMFTHVMYILKGQAMRNES
ncbi:DUF84 family protein [Gracilibacillus sp. YIM 98692]|uniref:DUF84 family protein n=1 Tax=Gracilibacillus sp. YIM 98692 TaxID=2663532 RepID=UPI0013D63136|nr:DUF84 family protein [Gracilibacillus sp. YIM 98692]